MNYSLQNKEQYLTKAQVTKLLDCHMADNNWSSVLLLPPDITRSHSGAGLITAHYYEQLTAKGVSVKVMPALGTHLPMTEAQLREDARANAEASIRGQAAIEQIVSLENLEATKEEIGEALAVICRQNNMTMEQLKPYYDAQFEAAVVRSVLTSKVMRLIRDAAEVTEN